MPAWVCTTGLTMLSPPPGPLRSLKLTFWPETRLPSASDTTALRVAIPPFTPILSAVTVSLMEAGVDAEKSTWIWADPPDVLAWTVAVPEKVALLR